MTKKPQTSKDAAEKVVKNIRRKTRQTYSAEEKIRIVLAGLRGEESICVLCRREGIAESLYYSWSKEFLEAGKRRLSGDTARRIPITLAMGMQVGCSIWRRRVPVPWGITH